MLATLHFWEDDHGIILSSPSWGIQLDTWPSEDTWVMGFIYSLLPRTSACNSWILYTDSVPEHFILGTKCQKVTSLETFRAFVFLLSCYHSVPPWGFVLHLKKKAKIVVLNPLPTAFLLPLPHPPGLPSPLHLEPAQLLPPIPSTAAPTRQAGCFRQTLSLSYKVKRSECLTRISIKQFLAKSEMLLPASSCDFWLVLAPCIHPYRWKLI